MRFRQPSRTLCAAVGILVMGTFTAWLGAQADSSLGTWKVNLAKSKYDPGPAPTSETRLYEPFEKNGLKATFTVIGADGSRATPGFAAHYDGKDYKYAGSADFDSIALKRIDSNTVESTLKKSGKIVQTVTAVVSEGGKVRTLTQMGINAKGQKVRNVVVLEKQ